MVAGLLCQDRVARIVRTDRVDNQALGGEVDLRHHVARALVADALDALIARDEQGTGTARHLLSERELLGQGGRSHRGPILADAVVQADIEPSVTAP